MKNIMILLLISLTFACTSSSNSGTESDNKATNSTELGRYQVLSSKAFANKLRENPKGQLIDVRTAAELVETGKIENAVHIDFYADDFKDQLTKLNKGQTVLLYCKSGGRSGKSAKILKNIGFKEVYDLEGGITKWLKEGRKVTK